MVDDGSQRPRGRMLISKDQQRYVEIDADKVARGAFYTKSDSWLVEPVRDFIEKSLESKFSRCLDPFAGGGDLLNACKDSFGCQIDGFDIVQGKWPTNDSLFNIPRVDHGLIVTNPPYLAKYSAARKGVLDESAKYFDSCEWEDLYQLALDRCLEACDRVVAIVPETFINSSYPKRHAELICVLERNPFQDTQTPVCVVCLDRDFIDGEENCKLYVDDCYAASLRELTDIKNASAPRICIRFNDVAGAIALKAVDGGNADDRIKFLRADQFNYSIDKIKVSSRLMTRICIPELQSKDLDDLLELSNLELEKIRKQSKDLIFSPFKGNNKAGVRRRRLDYKMARKILARATTQLQTRQH